MKKLNDLLPELGKILAHDFERFEITRMGILMDYAKVFDKLLDVLASPYPAEEEAAKVIEEFIASRQKPCGE
jgi:ferritin-like metal-binding protein YciE